jgi:hypothetical protein
LSDFSKREVNFPVFLPFGFPAAATATDPEWAPDKSPGKVTDSALGLPSSPPSLPPFSALFVSHRWAAERLGRVPVQQNQVDPAAKIFLSPRVSQPVVVVAGF